MEDVGQFYDHFGLFHGNLVYFMAIWYNLWPFGFLVYFSHGGMLHQQKSGNPDSVTRFSPNVYFWQFLENYSSSPHIWAMKYIFNG
jgi:hypothetical protein